MAIKHLILFDIDGTLVRCGPQIGPIFVESLKEVYGGFERPKGYNFSGKTDPRIVLDMVAHLGWERAKVLERLPEMQRVYFEQLERQLDPARMKLLAGVEMLLERLASRGDVMQALLTGNWQRSAEIKLAPFGLGRFFPFGAFGDDGVSRRELVPAALERAHQATGRRFAPEEVLIVGDSELDVDCAHASGVRCVAVTTGFTSAERLRAAGADWVFEDLVAASTDGGVEVFG